MIKEDRLFINQIIVTNCHDKKLLGKFWSELNVGNIPSEFSVKEIDFTECIEIMDSIIALITFKECLRYWNVHFNKKMTDEQFEDFWSKR